MLTRCQVEELLRNDPRAYQRAINGSPATAFALALERGLVSEEQVSQAREHYGHRWNYAGD